MSRKLYVGNLSYNATEEQLRELFAQAGEVSSVNIVIDRDTGNSRGFAFVEMGSDEGGKEAIKRFNNYSFGNRNLVVNEARPREDRGGGGGNRGGGGSRGGGDRRSSGGGYGNRDYNSGGNRDRW